MLIVAAAIFSPRGRLLAAKRSYPEALAGQWEFPGGKVEPGEDPRDALRREIREELGMNIELNALISGPNGDWPLPNGHPMRLWSASISDTALPQIGTSHSELRWLSADELNSVPWLPGDLQILPAVRRQMLLLCTKEGTHDE